MNLNKFRPVSWANGSRGTRVTRCLEAISVWYKVKLVQVFCFQPHMTHRKCNQTLFVQLSIWQSPKFSVAITCGYSLSTRLFLRSHLRARLPPRIMLPLMMLISRVRRHTEELAAPNSSSSLPTLFTSRNTIAFNLSKNARKKSRPLYPNWSKTSFFGQTNWSSRYWSVAPFSNDPLDRWHSFLYLRN